MIPRAIDRPAPPPPKPIELPAYDEVDATVLEVAFPNDKVVFTLFDGDTHEMAGGVIRIAYADNPRVGRFREEFMIFVAQVSYISERKVKAQIPREPFRPSQEMSQVGSAVPDAGDPPA